MSRCVILSAGPVEDIGGLRELLRADDIFIAADGGWRLAQELGVMPLAVVADFDSSQPPNLHEDVKIVRLPVQKDCTDTAAAVQVALDMGYRDFLLLGCIGGRLDHQFANFQLLSRLARQGCTALAANVQNQVCAAVTSPITVKPMDGWSLSLFAFDGTVRDLSIRGAAYELFGYDLTPTDSLCVSNATLKTPCEITFSEGTLLLFRSKD